MLNVEMNGYKRIQKNKARRLYNDGVTVYLLPCKVYPDDDHPWIKPFELNKKRIDDHYNGYDELKKLYTFDSRINNFEYYNCNAELGYYAAYYIKEG